jgi:hypothetical protein
LNRVQPVPGIFLTGPPGGEKDVRVRGNWRVFAELNNLTSRDRTEDEMFVNGTVNRRAERYGRTALFGIAFGF